MPFIKTFIDRYESNVLTRHRTVKTLSAVIRREGTRMVDNAELTISGKSNIEIEDYLSYLQDNINLEGLLGLWNFVGGVRDESGNALHEENALEGYVIKNTYLTFPKQSPTTGIHKGKVLGKRSMELVTRQALLTKIKIPDKKIQLPEGGGDSSFSIVDWSLDFTLAFFIKLNDLTVGSGSTRNRVIFDKYNDVTNKGIMFYVESSAADNTIQTLKIKIGNGSTNTIYSYATTATVLNNLDLHFCITRTNNVLKVYIDNLEIISETFTNDITSTADIYLGKEYSETTSALVEPVTEKGGLKCTYHQMRLYSRAWSVEEISTWVGLIAPSMTLKFYGRIWKKDLLKNGIEKVYCKGLGSLALNTRIDASLLTGDVANVRFQNVYVRNVYTSQIINDILTVVNEKFFGTSKSDMIMLSFLQYIKGFNTNTSNQGHQLRAPFIAEGTFVDILNDLSVLSQSVFTFLPTGILHIEENKFNNPDDRLLTRGGFILSNKNCTIIEKGKDDSNMCNHLLAACRIDEYIATDKTKIIATHLQNYWSTGSLFLAGGGVSCDVFPLTVYNVTSNGVAVNESDVTYPATPSASSYWIDLRAGKIYFYNKDPYVFNRTWKYSYTYNLNSAMHPNAPAVPASASVLQPNSGTSTSITKNGLYSRKLSVPRLTSNIDTTSIDGAQDITLFATNFVGANEGDFTNKLIPVRIQVRVNAFLDHIMENSNIGIHNITKGIGSVDINGDITPVYLQIKKIEYHYPEGNTILELGDFLYDSFDLEKQNTEGLRSVQSNQF